jgi:hypothetical protein
METLVEGNTDEILLAGDITSGDNTETFSEDNTETFSEEMV